MTAETKEAKPGWRDIFAALGKLGQQRLDMRLGIDLPLEHGAGRQQADQRLGD